MVVSLFLGLLQQPVCKCSWKERCLSQCKFRLLFAHSLANGHETQEANLCWAIGAVSLIGTMDQLLETTGFSFNYSVICDQELDLQNCPAVRCCNTDNFAIDSGNQRQGSPAMSPVVRGRGKHLGLECRNMQWVMWGCPLPSTQRGVGWLYKLLL